MRTIYEARRFIRENVSKTVEVKVKGIRNKNELFVGSITDCYPNVFMISTDKGNKSFSYTDVLIGNIEVKLK